MKGRLLVVDDDAAIRETLHDHLASEGYDVAAAASAEQALNRLADFDPALVISDVRMPGMTGIELTARIRAARPDTHVIVITAHEDIETAVGAMRAGAFDLLVKPLDLARIEMLVDRCLQDRALRQRVQQYTEDAAEPYALPRLVGRNPRMVDIYKTIGTVAATRTPVLIRGETGTGKELIARALHYNSDRATEPFIAINCTALPEALLESELFGHVRGAFTGATHDRRGRFELAGAGTLFLDEVGDTAPGFQAKLLRVLQEREFEPLGSERTRRTEARVIAATHRDLEERMRDGSFREDLYFRLRVIELSVPALRERRADVPLLARHLLDRIGAELHRRLELPQDVEDALLAYDWPGNVRELENALTRAAVLARGSSIALEHLALGPGAAHEGYARRAGSDEVAPPPDADARLSLADAERGHVMAVLRATAGNKRSAARLLRITRPRLDRLLARHGIMASDYGPHGIDT
jgi:DNA-binding NtrC family response regulator